MDKLRKPELEEIDRLQDEVSTLEKQVKRQNMHRFQRNVLREEQELLTKVINERQLILQNLSENVLIYEEVLREIAS